MEIEDQNAITLKRSAILPYLSVEAHEVTNKEQIVSPASLQTQITHRKSRARMWLFLLPFFAYMMAVVIGTHATFLLLTATSLPVILLQFFVAAGMGLVGNFMFALLLFLVT